MPTGPKHYKVHASGTEQEWSEDCRCTVGEDHDDEGNALSNYLSAEDAELIWLSNGMDEDYDFR